MEIGVYAYLWEYRVRPEHVEAFARLYGPDGEWVALFRRAGGWLDTTLLRDRADACRFVTLDRWRTRGDYQRFRERFAAEYARIDALGDGMTESEMLLGEFAPPA